MKVTFKSPSLSEYDRTSPSLSSHVYSSPSFSAHDNPLQHESDSWRDDFDKLPSDGGPGMYKSQWKHIEWQEKKRLEKLENDERVENRKELRDADEVEEAQVRAELENGVEDIGDKVEPEEVESALVERKHSHSHDSEADKGNLEGEPTRKKKMHSLRVEVRLPKDVGSIKLIVKLGGDAA